MMTTKKRLFSVAIASLFIKQPMALDQIPPKNRLDHNTISPQINDHTNNNDDDILQITTALMTGQANRNTMDTGFCANFDRLSSLLAMNQMDDQLRKAIYNIADLFGHHFNQDLPQYLREENVIRAAA